MKRITKTSALLLAAVLICTTGTYLGCKKTESVPEPAFQATNESTLSVLKSWVVESKRSENSNGQKLIDSVLAYASWQQSVLKSVSNGKSVIYVPLHNSITGLEFFYDGKNQKVDSCNIVTVEHKEATSSTNKIFAVQAYYESVVLKQPVPATFAGKISAYSITGRYLYDYTFGDGKIICHGLIAPKGIEAKTPKVNDVGLHGCETYGYYAIYETYSVLLYTFQICSSPILPDCTPPSMSISIGGGTQFIRVNCAPGELPNDGYHGGGGGESQPVCNFTSTSAQQLLSTQTSEKLEFDGTIGYGSEVTDAETGVIEKDFKPSTWKFYKTTLPAYFSLTYGAIYRGKLYKNSATDAWKFKSVAYISNSRVAGALPPCFAFSMAVEDLGTTIDANKLHAVSELHYHGQLSLTCIGTVELGSPDDETTEQTWIP